MSFCWLHFSSYAMPYCCKYEILITRYPVIFKFRDGTGRVIEKKIGSGRVPGSRQTLHIAYMHICMSWAHDWLEVDRIFWFVWFVVLFDHWPGPEFFLPFNFGECHLHWNVSLVQLRELSKAEHFQHFQHSQETWKVGKFNGKLFCMANLKYKMRRYHLPYLKEWRQEGTWERRRKRGGEQEGWGRGGGWRKEGGGGEGGGDGGGLRGGALHKDEESRRPRT